MGQFCLLSRQWNFLIMGEFSRQSSDEKHQSSAVLIFFKELSSHRMEALNVVRHGSCEEFAVGGHHIFWVTSLLSGFTPPHIKTTLKKSATRQVVRKKNKLSQKHVCNGNNPTLSF